MENNAVTNKWQYRNELCVGVLTTVTLLAPPCTARGGSTAGERSQGGEPLVGFYHVQQ